MYNEYIPANDIRNAPRGYPHNAELMRAHLPEEERLARQEYDDAFIARLVQAEKASGPSSSEEVENQELLASAREAVAEALYKMNETSVVDISSNNGIIEFKLPKTATVEILDKVA